MSRQSNLQVESSKSVSRDQLMNQLRDEARRQGKPFGLLFDNIEGGFTTTGRGSPNAFNVLPNVVYRIYTDGRDARARQGGRPHRHSAGRVWKDHRDRRSRRCVQRRLRRRKRRRASLGLIALAAGERGRGAEEISVAGDETDPARPAGSQEIMTAGACSRMVGRLAAVGLISVAWLFARWSARTGVSYRRGHAG